MSEKMHLALEEHTKGPLEEHLKKAIVEGVELELQLNWGDALDKLHDAFLLDIQEKAEVDAHLCMKEDHENIEDGSELYVSPYMDYFSIGQILPLSELLTDAVGCYGKKAAMQALETSLAKFRADQQED